MRLSWPLVAPLVGCLAAPGRVEDDRGAKGAVAEGHHQGAPVWPPVAFPEHSSFVPGTTWESDATPAVQTTDTIDSGTSSTFVSTSSSVSIPTTLCTSTSLRTSRTSTSRSTSHPTSTSTSTSTSPWTSTSAVSIEVASTASSTPFIPTSAASPTSRYGPSEDTGPTASRETTSSENAPWSPPTPPSAAWPSPLTTEQQVGNSTWGALGQPTFPQWLDGHAAAPWGDCTVHTCDASVRSDIPVTHITRSYNFTVSRGEISADGVLRDVILVNGQFPGPLIEANWGDWIQVTVHNNITDPLEGTTLHWHGLSQRGTPWEDGVPSAAQCPIAPGHSFTYLYQAELYGTSWYHAHYSAQFSAGVAGPMVIHGPTSLPYDVDIGPVMLSDWYHIPYFALVRDAVGTNFSVIPPTSDSNLINGRGRFNCSDSSFDSANEALSSYTESNLTWTCVDDAPLSRFRFQSGKTHLLRLINHGANGVQKFSIDHHNLTVIAVDFVPVVPYTVDVATLGVGQRADVLVTALDTPTASIWMRSSAPGGETCGGSNSPEALAAIYYEWADTTVEPTSKSANPINETSTSCTNDPLGLTMPAYSLAAPLDSWTQDIGLSLVVNSTGNFEFQINGQAFHADYNIPLLPQAVAGNFSFQPQWNVYNFEQNASIILNITNNMPLVHPFHLHGHNFYILNVDGPSDFSSSPASSGNGGPVFSDGWTWNGTVINPSNPLRRDGILIPPYGFAAIQFELNNPGVWPFHCHIAWHLSGGQGMNILYKAQDIPALPEGFVQETCVAWDSYSSHNVVDQIDAGA